MTSKNRMKRCLPIFQSSTKAPRRVESREWNAWSTIEVSKKVQQGHLKTRRRGSIMISVKREVEEKKMRKTRKFNL